MAEHSLDENLKLVAIGLEGHATLSRHSRARLSCSSRARITASEKVVRTAAASSSNSGVYFHLARVVGDDLAVFHSWP
jgi:hypothetical protein